ncbi:MAG: GNAT family N-acetyltransferase [Phototrophicaceae bacterium]
MALVTLETQRLLLRPLNHNDLDDLYEYAQDPAVYQPGMWQPYDSKEQARQHLDELLASYNHGLMWWAIEHKADQKMIGRCELSHIDRDDHHAEIGYALHQNYWRKGIMIEALQQIMTYAFNTMNLNRLHAKTLITNTASQKLLIKAGFQQEGHLRQHSQVKGYPEDVYIYGLLRSDTTTS